MKKTADIMLGALLVLFSSGFGTARAIEWTWTGAASSSVQAHLHEKSKFPWLGKNNPVSRSAGLKDVEIELEHIHLAIGAEFNDRFSFSVAPCIEHEGTLSIRMAYLEAVIMDWDMETILSAEVGRFLVPFGRFNYLAEVTNFPTISRPMMFASHDQDIMYFQGFPHPLFMSQYSEVGMTLNGNKWLMDKHQFWYAAWIGNGLYQEGFAGHTHGGVLGTVMNMAGMGKSAATKDEGHGATASIPTSGVYNGKTMSPADISWLQKTRFAVDNNSDKAFGGRLVYGYKEILSAGVSYMQGKYDPDAMLAYKALGFDASLDIETRVGDLRMSGEYMRAPISFAAYNDTSSKRINIGEYTLSGYYGQVLYSFAKRWELVGVYDVLMRDGPETKTITTMPILATGAEDERSLIRKVSGGINVSPVEQVKVKTEYALYQFQQQYMRNSIDNVHRLSAALVVSF